MLRNCMRHCLGRCFLLLIPLLGVMTILTSCGRSRGADCTSADTIPAVVDTAATTAGYDESTSSEEGAISLLPDSVLDPERRFADTIPPRASSWHYSGRVDSLPPLVMDSAILFKHYFFFREADGDSASMNIELYYRFPTNNSAVAKSLQRWVLEDSALPPKKAASKYFERRMLVRSEGMDGVAKDGQPLNDYSINYGVLFSDSLVYDGATVASFELVDWADEGGVHPSWEYRAISVDKKTGRILKIHDLIRPECDRYLANLAVIYLLRGGHMDKDFAYDTSGDVYSNPHRNILLDLRKDNLSFCLNGQGLTLYFSPYEIAPYAFGLMTVRLPYKSLLPMLKPAAVLRPFVSPLIASPKH